LKLQQTQIPVARACRVRARAVDVSGLSVAHADDAGLPKLANKKPLRVGFAQTESNNPWRLAETKSFKDIAAKCGWQLVMTDANSSASKQVADIRA